MGFRRKIDHKQRALERAWIDQHWPTLKAIGLPPIVFVDFAHWADFLDNGCIDHHPDTTRFSIDELSTDQLNRLCDFLEGQYGDETPVVRLLGWLRVQLTVHRAGNLKPTK